MKISDMISVLSEIQKQYGDLIVTNNDSDPNDGYDSGYSIELHFDLEELDLVLGIDSHVKVSDVKLVDTFTRLTGIKLSRLKIVSSNEVFIRPFVERRNI